MHKATSTSIGRLVLALIAVLAVAGPGLVFAGAPVSQYAKPQFARLIGPSSVPKGTTATYTMEVTFTDGTTAIVTPTSTSTSHGDSSFSTSGLYTAPPPTSSEVGDYIIGVYVNSAGSVRAGKGITLTGGPSV